MCMVYRSFLQIPNAEHLSKNTSFNASKTRTKEAWKLKSLSRSLQKFFKPCQRELVAGGDIKWKPIDKPAAMLLARSPEINKPPQINMPIVQTRVEEYGKITKKQEAELESGTNAALLRTMSKKADEMPGNVEAYAKAMASAKASLDMGVDLFREGMMEFALELPKHVEKLRNWRMTMERERDTSLKALRELRQFFPEDAHEKEMTRLNEFVRMCERLKALSEDGTLEKVADVMLKLSNT